MRTMATTGGVPSGRQDERERHGELEQRSPVRHDRGERARAAGRAGSPGTCAAGASAKRVSGLLLVITQTTLGKWWLSFENPAQNQSASWTALAPAIQFGAKAKQDDRDPVVLGAGREEEGLVGDPGERHEQGERSGSARARGTARRGLAAPWPRRRGTARRRAGRASCRRTSVAAERAAAWSCPCAGSRERRRRGGSSVP